MTTLKGGLQRRSTRVNLALTLMAIAIVLNLIVLFTEDTRPAGRSRR
jgi:hypothetical protein